MYRQSEKNLLNGNISSTCPHNMVNIGALAAEIDSRVWGTTANFNRFRVLALIVTAATSLNGSQRNFARHLPSSGLAHYIQGLLPLTEFCHVQNSLCVQVLRSLILAALMHGTPAAKLCGVVQGMELSQRAPPIFDWAAITLGVGPHF